MEAWLSSSASPRPFHGSLPLRSCARSVVSSSVARLNFTCLPRSPARFSSATGTAGGISVWASTLFMVIREPPTLKSPPASRGGSSDPCCCHYHRESSPLSQGAPPGFCGGLHGPLLSCTATREAPVGVRCFGHLHREASLTRPGGDCCVLSPLPSPVRLLPGSGRGPG